MPVHRVNHHRAFDAAAQHEQIEQLTIKPLVHKMARGIVPIVQPHITEMLCKGGKQFVYITYNVLSQLKQHEV